MSRIRWTPSASALLLIAGCAPTTWKTEATGPQPLGSAFELAAQEHDVPRDLLLAIAYSMTRLEEGEPGTHEHAGVRGWGPMDLGAGAPFDGPSIERAALRLGVDEQAIQEDPVINIQAAASELRWRADLWEAETGLELVTLSDWAEVVGWYGGSEDGGAQRSYARQVYRWIEGGLLIQGPAGEWLEIDAQELDLPYLDLMPVSGLGDYSGVANFVAAHGGNYSNASRGPGEIDMIVVHTAQGSYSGTYNWFANSAASASAHYVIRSADGEVTQMVWEQDVAWHAGHSSTNSRSVGIELEGFIERPETWFTEPMYRSLAALIVNIADRQGVALDRTHIIGHNEVPGCSSGRGGGRSCHTDPGSGFDWDRLFDAMADLETDSGDSSDPGGGDDGAETGGDGGTEPGSGTTGSPEAGLGSLVGFVREGSIYDTTAGVAGARISLSSGQSTTTDGNGWYALSDVPAGWVELSVSASGYGTVSTGTDVTADITNWRSVELTGSGSSSPIPGAPVNAIPTGWSSVAGPSVTLSWDGAGAAASRYEVKIYWYDGADWNTYYTYSTTTDSKTFWPTVDDTWYAWAARGINSAGTGAWTDLNYFWFEN